MYYLGPEANSLVWNVVVNHHCVWANDDNDYYTYEYIEMCGGNGSNCDDDGNCDGNRDDNAYLEDNKQSRRRTRTTKYRNLLYNNTSENDGDGDDDNGGGCDNDNDDNVNGCDNDNDNNGGGCDNDDSDQVNDDRNDEDTYDWLVKCW